MKIYTVQKGDTMYKIAKHHNITLDQLLKLNPDIKNPDQIMPGMKVKIPASHGTSAHHTAVPGHPKTKDHWPHPTQPQHMATHGVKGTAPKPHFPMVEEPPAKKTEYKPTAHLAPLMPLAEININNQEFNEKFIQQQQITQQQHEVYPNMILPKAKHQGSTYPIHHPQKQPQQVLPYQGYQPQPYPCYPQHYMPAMYYHHSPCGCRGYVPQQQSFYPQMYPYNDYSAYTQGYPQPQQNQGGWSPFPQPENSYTEFPRSFPTK